MVFSFFTIHCDASVCPHFRTRQSALARQRVSGGSNYDSLTVAKCLVIYLVKRLNGLARVPLSLSAIQRNHRQGNGLGRTSGESQPVELDSSSTFIHSPPLALTRPSRPKSLVQRHQQSSSEVTVGFLITSPNIEKINKKILLYFMLILIS